jgi:hypothetical protein
MTGVGPVLATALGGDIHQVFFFEPIGQVGGNKSVPNPPGPKK